MGATFTAPKGWWVTEGGAFETLEEPDHQLKSMLVETPEPDPIKAIDAAWQLVQPGFAMKRLHDPQAPPPPRGWDSFTTVDYDAADHRAVVAAARRYGATTYVALIDGDDAHRTLTLLDAQMKYVFARSGK